MRGSWEIPRMGKGRALNQETYRVQYWGPDKYRGIEDGKEKYTKTHNAYRFDDETSAQVKYMELVARQTFGTMELETITFEVLYDYGDGASEYKRVLEQKRVG